MENVMIKNAQGEQINIKVIRYFKLNGLEYLVFSLNEVDEGGYVKLYIAKVNNNMANTITDDVEWNLIKDTIKTVIKSNKDNLPLHITDLDTKKLVDIQLFDQKVFKISDSFLQLLSANKKIETPIEENASDVLETPNINDISETVSDSLNEVKVPQAVNPTELVIDTPMVNTTEISSGQNLNYQETSSKVVEPSVSNYEVNSDGFVGNSDYTLDYKTLYENELNKNQMLIEENQKYKTMIDSLKNIINETF